MYSAQWRRCSIFTKRLTIRTYEFSFYQQKLTIRESVVISLTTEKSCLRMHASRDSEYNNQAINKAAHRLEPFDKFCSGDIFPVRWQHRCPSRTLEVHEHISSETVKFRSSISSRFTLTQNTFLHFLWHLLRITHNSNPVLSFIQGVPGGMNKTSGECSLC